VAECKDKAKLKKELREANVIAAGMYRIFFFTCVCHNFNLWLGIKNKRRLLQVSVTCFNLSMKAVHKINVVILSFSDNRLDESFFSKLDSSLKKNTAFVKKLVCIGSYLVTFFIKLQ
jgi:hypothetical protein